MRLEYCHFNGTYNVHGPAQWISTIHDNSTDLSFLRWVAFLSSRSQEAGAIGQLLVEGRELHVHFLELFPDKALLL